MKKKWIIKEGDVQGRIFVSDSLYVISLFIIGTTLFFDNKFFGTTIILEEARQEYTKKSSLTKEEKISIETMKLFILESYDLIVLEENISPKDTDNFKKIEKCYKLLREMKNIEGEHANTYALEARLKFITKKDAGVDEALILTEKQERCSPYGDAAPSYSKAFLYFYKGNLEFGWNHLKNAVEEGRRLVMPLGVISFYEESITQSPDKKQLYFPLGYLYFHDSGDHLLARENLEKFIDSHEKISNKSEIIEKLLKESKNILAKI
ncbi:MAG: hypothetical protein PHQ06_04970 [Atribacterota bacterium]|nr:hypothetical protein [Atribacterota bacterium]